MWSLEKILIHWIFMKCIGKGRSRKKKKVLKSHCNCAGRAGSQTMRSCQTRKERCTLPSIHPRSI